MSENSTVEAVKREKGPVEILCREINFPWDVRLERSAVLVAFAAELLTEIDGERSVMARVGEMVGTFPSDGSRHAIQAAWGMFAGGTDAERIARAAAVHDLCHELNPEGAHPTDHLIDMVSSIASAVRFGLQSPCASRHAAAAANHVWKRLYGVSCFDSMTAAWEKDWARSKLTGVLVTLASPALASSREQALDEALRLTKRALDEVALWDSTVADCIPDKLATTIRDARTSAAALLTPEQPAPPPVFVLREG